MRGTSAGDKEDDHVMRGHDPLSIGRHVTRVRRPLLFTFRFQNSEHNLYCNETSLLIPHSVQHISALYIFDFGFLLFSRH